MPGLHVPAGRPIRPPELLIRCVQCRASVPCTCSVLLRRSVVAEAGGFEPGFPRLYDAQVVYRKISLLPSALPVEGSWSRSPRHPEFMTMRAAAYASFLAARRVDLTWLRD